MLEELGELVQRFNDGSNRNYLTGQFHGIRCKGVNGHPDFTVETVDAELPKLDWVIIGGESGPGARPFVMDWGASIILQCKAAGVPVFMKQVGSKPMINADMEARGISSSVWGPIKDSKGGVMEEWPLHLRVREFPKASVPA